MKAVRYIALAVFGFLWFLGCSRSTVVYLVDNGFIGDDFRYGDLYRLSNLSAYRVPVEKCRAPYTGEKVPVTLYLAGDSFTEEGRVPATQYAGTGYFRAFVADEGVPLEQVPGRKILVIETVERHLRERFSEKPWMNWVGEAPGADPANAPFTFQKLYQAVLDYEIPYREEMHESVLFSNDFILKIKEWKADLIYRMFGRTDPKVAVLKGELVYELDLAPGVSSVYDVVSDEEIARIVRHANATRDHYLNLGFDEVYLSVIPNKSSLLIKDDPAYNHLIERIEGHPELQIPLISVWKAFTEQNYYQKGDSHWNCAGQKIWVDAVNERLHSPIGSVSSH